MAKWDQRDKKIKKRIKRKQQNQSSDYSRSLKKKKIGYNVSDIDENVEYRFLRSMDRTEDVF